MSQPVSKKPTVTASPRWPSISVVLFVACLVGTPLFAIWFIGQQRQVAARVNFAEVIEPYGGRIVPVVEVATPGVVPRLPWIRRLLGDRPVAEIQLPYGFERLRKNAKGFFPEVKTISVAPSGPAMAKMFGGEAGLEILRHPDLVQACLLEVPNKKIASPEAVGGYRPKGDETEVPVAAAAPLGGVLLEPDSYEWDMKSACMPEFGVRMTWRRGSERIDLLVCFNCSEMLIYRDHHFVGSRDIEAPLRNHFLATTKSSFPDDAAIQALKPCGSGATPEPLPVAY